MQQIKLMNKNILVYGYFGSENNQLDGQTVKTRSIFQLLEENVGELDMTVSKYDTQIYKKNKKNIINSWCEIYKSDILFYIPAQNNLKFLFPFIYFICKMKGIQIHYVVVGGWLNDFLKNLPLHRMLLKRINKIYPQTNELTFALTNNYSFKNVEQLHNFRFTDDVQISTNSISKEIKLVFMARIHPKKGVDTLFKLAKTLLDLSYIDVRIDIYGPIFEQYKNEFEKSLEESNNIKYCGVIEPNKIVKTLSQYDLFLFPTEYFTEGFPGSILEAYLANLPVVVSRWKYAEEFIEQNVTGIISDFENPENFIDEVIKLLNTPNKIEILKQGVIKAKMKYTPNGAWKIIKNNLQYL